MNAKGRSTTFGITFGSIRLDLPHRMAVLWLAPLMFLPLTITAAGVRTPNLSTIPLDQIGATVETKYSRDGVSVCATDSGARLACVFQKMEGEVAHEGLWLTSTAEDSKGERFRVLATAVERATSENAGDPLTPTLSPTGEEGAREAGKGVLPRTGTVVVAGNVARFIRPGLTEEYRVSVDGVRQDFLIAPRPGGQGQLRVDLDVAGAKAEPLADGARLVLEGSGRKLNYHRLRVTDATGRELPAWMGVASVAAEATRLKSMGRDRGPSEEVGLLTSAATARTLAVLVDDTEAIYPVRIDPTFSDANWFSLGGIPGADGSVIASVVDGSGNLYIGGLFRIVGDVVANYIAKWNGSEWSSLGSGMNSYVYALAVSGSDLYAGGSFTTASGGSANHIAKWDGSNWSTVGSGMNSSVYALAVSDGDLYAGGDFTTAGSVSANRIAKWNGSGWSALGSGMNQRVAALAVSGSNLYAGGLFTTAGGVGASHIAQWAEGFWSALGSGMGGGDRFPNVYALAVSGSDLYAGGAFTFAGAVRANYIARWNPATGWSALDSGMNDNVYALAASGDNLYAGGLFTSAGGVSANGIAQWNPATGWTDLGLGMNIPAVYALAASGSNLYAGGSFAAAGANQIARWNPATGWSALGSGLNNYPSALAVLDGDLCAGGFLAVAEDLAATNIARWNGSSWMALGSGMNHRVYGLAVSGNELYAGGGFTTADGASANRIAKWDGSEWSTVGSGMNSSVYALAVSDIHLYAGGLFTNAGGIGANHVAKWSGSEWSALGMGMNSSVRALAVSSGDVYAGGDFTTAGGGGANRIAKWNGSRWSALGSGVNNQVNALAVSGSDLYAGGVFTTAGGVAVNRIAKWTGSSWTALGSGMNGTVYALAVSGGDVYAGGAFTTAGGSPASYIAKWNGTSWSALGSGMNGPVAAFAVSGSDLYAGGAFTTAGGKVSGYVARAYLERPTLWIFRSGGDLMLSWPTFYETFVLQQNPEVANSNNWSNANYPLTTNGAIKSATIPLTPTNHYFRLIGN